MGDTNKLVGRYRWLSDYYLQLADVTESGDENLIGMVTTKIEVTLEMIKKLKEAHE